MRKNSELNKAVRWYFAWLAAFEDQKHYYDFDSMHLINKCIKIGNKLRKARSRVRLLLKK